MSIRLRVATLVCAMACLSSASGGLADAQEPNRAAPDSGRGTRKTERVQSTADSDTSMLTGSGINATSGPIDRPAPGGAMRKDPGSGSWYFVKGLTGAELELEYQRHLDELVRKHGHEPRDIVIAIRDTTDVARLRAFKISVSEAPPCTVSVRVLYRQLPELKKVGLTFWGKGDPRPTPGVDKRRNLPSKSAPPRGAPTPGGGRPTPRPLSSAQPDGLLSTQAVAFSEGFEDNTVPGTYWSSADDNPNSGLDSWGDLNSECAQVRLGSWSASCSGHGDAPCFAYDNDQNAHMQNPVFFDMSGYSSYTASFYYWLSSEFCCDRFRAYYSTGGLWEPWFEATGVTGGWVQRTLVLNNADHLYDSFAYLFKFESDATIVSGAGAYVDDLLIEGTLRTPNLTYYTPGGWSGPIVPSSLTGTTTTGTLYAGQPTYIDWAILNNGSANATGSFSIEYYFDGAFIGSDTRSGLNVSTGYTLTDWSYTVTTSGNHTLKMVIDPTNVIAESNESSADNTYQQTFFWNPPLPPDLVVQSLTVNNLTPTVGQSVTATVTIKNQGTGTASGSFHTRFWKSLATPPLENDSRPADNQHTTFSLAAGSTETYSIPDLTSQVAGPWTMYAYVDATNLIPTESNNGNNASTGTVVTWQPLTAPDLIVQSLTVSNGNPSVGQPVTATLTIKNQGTVAAAGPFYTRFWKNLGASPVQGQGGEDRQWQSNSGLAAGATETFTVTGLTATSAGTWTMYAYVDVTNAVTSESNKTNNVSSPRTVVWSSDSLQVSGVVAFDDTTYTADVPRDDTPLPCVKVILFESDVNQGTSDDTLAVGRSDSDGGFTFGPLFNNDQDADHGPLDLYVRVYLDAQAACLGENAVVVEDSSGTVWTYQSNTMQDMTTPFFGVVEPLDYARRSACHLYSTLVVQGYGTVATGGVVPGRPWLVRVRWQPGYEGYAGHSAYLPHQIRILGDPTESGYAPDEWDDAMILHEYGHHLAYIFDFSDPAAGGAHSPTEPQPIIRSWSEGWADYFMTLTRRLGFAPRHARTRNVGAIPSGSTWTVTHWFNLDIENGKMDQDGTIIFQAHNDSINYEVANAGVLWDFFDTANDNQNGDACDDSVTVPDGQNRVWQATAGHGPDVVRNMADFYKVFRERYGVPDPPFDRLLKEVFCEHAMEALCEGGQIAALGDDCHPTLGVETQRSDLALIVAPNPSRGGVRIGFEVPANAKDERLQLRIYDIAGRLIRTVADGVLRVGKHELVWDGASDEGRRVAAGIYLCRLWVKNRSTMLSVARLP